MDAARGRKGRNLVLHLADAMVDQHGAHREARPVHAVLINIVTACHLIDGLDDKVLVFGTTGIPCGAIAAQISNDKLGRVDHLVHLIRTILVFRTLVHTMGDDEEW